MLDLSNKTFKIVEKFKYFIAVSLVVILAGVIMLAVAGMNVGIDFSGGATIQIELSGAGSGTSDVKKAVDGLVKEIVDENGIRMSGAVQSSPSEGGYTYEFRLTYYHNGALKTQAEEVDFINFIRGDMADESDNGLCGVIEEKMTALIADGQDGAFKGVSEEVTVVGGAVGATASSALLRNAIIALVVAIALMLIYILIRFKLSSALAAIVALIHDVLIMIAVTVIFRVPVNSTFIAAVITIVGYSINATIVIFDRIREERKFESSKTKTLETIANESISKTLMRSVLTSLTTLVIVVFLAILGVSAIKEFVLPIIFGLIAGTYSSVFLASAFWVFFEKLFQKVKTNRRTGEYVKRKQQRAKAK